MAKTPPPSETAIAPAGPAVPGLVLSDGGAEPIVAMRAQVLVKGTRTVFEMVVSRPVAAQVFTLPSPYRIVVDIPDLEFRLPREAGASGRGLVTAYRYGVFAPGRSRVVIDTNGPARIVRSEVVPAPAGQEAKLQIELESTTAELFAATVSPPSSALPAIRGTLEPKQTGKFVVMIDPGHGGIDGGAISGSQIIEKEIVLAFGRQLRAALEAKNRYDVHMTRSSDVFVSLNQRVELSQEAGAHLFISIHADSVGDAALARTARGASIYTLSETASNQAAQAYADKENSADSASGLSGLDDGQQEQVNSILADLTKRETHNFSLEFKSLLIDRLRPTNVLSRDPARAAAFKVLRQTRTPTVLIELGFLTHEMDVHQMQSADWQKRVVGAIATAVDSYFAKRTVAQR